MNNAQQQLLNSLHSLATINQIAEVLGIKDIDSQPEEFWVAQKRAVKNRFYWYCLSKFNIPLSTEIEELTDEQLENVSLLATMRVEDPTFTYANIRDWYKAFGEFAADKAFKFRRERRDLETRCLRVLFVFDKGAKYLGMQHGEAVLRDEAGAYTFRVESPTELSKTYLTEMAKHFESLMNQFGALQVKILQGRI